ncbi:hypothetical protein ncot_00160 [Nocardioides sp. JQ2195]|uniref:hypothetical protein n=1 Tax=Nocardioides sp. JQ2195 TaxID=2592334 RepID=UPI00143E5BD9|nr:hypothetical protein [Nocardioides sp. JQ2195]QIX25172.1 hypothetical protein ncot_00160 [Nocardioides sp. JQ2195]
MLDCRPRVIATYTDAAPRKVAEERRAREAATNTVRAFAEKIGETYDAWHRGSA